MAGHELFPDERLTPVDQRYTIQFEPSVFYAAPGGEFRLPGSSSAAAVVKLQDLNLDQPRASPFGELHIRSGDWRVSLSGFEVSLNDEASSAPAAGQVGSLSFNGGDRISSSISFASGECVVARELGAPPAISGKLDPDLALGIEAYGGVRFYDVSLGVTTPTGTASAEQFFLQPIVGVKATLDIVQKFTIDLQTGMGGFSDGNGHTSISYDILAGFMYRPVENVGIQVGYRMFIYTLKDGPESGRFDYRGAVAGLYAGLVFKF